ncbi:MAG: GNAT family N-acetyltransferase [Acidobacteria bacterium]|nr:GNAT family N-acetyltransferase [Acidobacteriota bacterium]
METKKGDFLISTDNSSLDLSVIHSFLTNSYWASGIPIDIVKKSIENSLCFGLYNQGNQVGFARVISDYATFAYLADVFILPSERGKGLSKWLMETIKTHPKLQGLRRWMLATRDAHGLYKQFGFEPIANPERLMAILNSNVYE